MSMTLRLLQLNEVRLVGRLTRDPEMRFTAKGQGVCRFDLAVNRRYKDVASGEWKDDTSFISVVTWRDMAQRCADFLKKGSPVYVEGRLKSRAWETKEGQKRTTIEVDARRVQFLAKAEGSSDGPSASEGESGSEVPAGVGSDDSGDEDIPF